MAEHPDVQRFRQALEARTDASVQDLFADDVVWHGGGSGGDASGKDAVVRQWADSGGPGLSVTEVYADGVHTIGRLERSDTPAGRAQMLAQTAPQTPVMLDDRRTPQDGWAGAELDRIGI